MTELTLEEFEKDFDAYMDRIEAGESFLIRQPDGRAVVACPADEIKEMSAQVGITDIDELSALYQDHEEAS